MSYSPDISDEAVKAKTGKGWTEWFALMDRKGAATLNHKEIAKLAGKAGAGPWWSQMVTVQYERARGLRDKHERTGGYSVNVSKTVPCSLSALYVAFADAKSRRRFFPKGALAITSQTKDKYLRGKWNDARIEIGFLAKGKDKSQVAIQLSKLASAEVVETERAQWKKAMERLAEVLAV